MRAPPLPGSRPDSADGAAGGAARGGHRLPVALAAAAALARLPFLGEPLYSDQALFSLIGAGLRGGAAPYTDLWDHKPPLLYVAYALAEAWPGGVAAAEIALVAACAVFFAGIMARVSGPRAGAWAGFLYAIFYNNAHFGGFWSRLQPEVVGELPFLMGLWLLLGGAGRRRAAAAGVALAASVWVKFTIAPAALAYLVVLAEPGRRRAAGAFAAGFVGLTAAVVAWLAAAGALPDAWHAVFGFNLHHASAPSLWVAAAALPALVALFFPFSVFAALGPPPGTTGRRFLAAWAAGALAAVAIQGRWWPYHCLPLSAPLIGLAAPALSRWLTDPSRALAFRAALALAALSPFALALGRYHLVLHPRWSPGFVEGFAGPVWGLVGGAWGRLADGGGAGARPGDSLYVQGYEPSLFRLSGLPVAGRFPLHYPVSDDHTDRVFRARSRAELMRIFDEDPPAFVITHPMPGAGDVIGSFAGLRAALEADYEVALTVGARALWVRGGR